MRNRDVKAWIRISALFKSFFLISDHAGFQRTYRGLVRRFKGDLF